jgi:type II secretory pathway pseudopilin PulG
MKSSASGFSLLEVLLAVGLLLWLLSAGLAFVGAQRQRLHLAEARLALQHNARFLESLLLRQPDYALIGRQWPQLPVTETEHYWIVFGSQVEHTPGRYRLLAIAKQDSHQPGRAYLRLDQNGVIATCWRIDQKEYCEVSGRG